MISTVLAVALGFAVQDSSRLLLPGYADLPAIAGDANCGPVESGADCVIVRVETINETFYEYVALLEQSGWRFNGGAAVVFYFQRKRPDGGCEGIDLAAIADFEMITGEDAKEEDMRFPSMIMFFKRLDVPCASEPSQ